MREDEERGGGGGEDGVYGGEEVGGSPGGVHDVGSDGHVEAAGKGGRRWRCPVKRRSRNIAVIAVNTVVLPCLIRAEIKFDVMIQDVEHFRVMICQNHPGRKMPTKDTRNSDSCPKLYD